MPDTPFTAIVIRAAVVADMAAVAAIYADEVIGGTATFEIEPPDEGEMWRRHGVVTAAGHPWIVAETGGRIAGYAYASAFRARPAFRYTVENSVYVASTARGAGIGRRLLARLVEACAALGFRQMVAVIGDSPRQAASIRLHSALGFEMAGRLPDVGWKQGQWLDTVLMQRPLGPAGASPPTSPPTGA